MMTGLVQHRVVSPDHYYYAINLKIVSLNGDGGGSAWMAPSVQSCEEDVEKVTLC